MLNEGMPRGFLRPCVLLMLREAPVHGYELLDRLAELGFDTSSPGTVYRVLRALESEGVVRSQWEDGAAGNHRRRSYRLTADGVSELEAQAQQLVAWQRRIESFLERYLESERQARRHPPQRRYAPARQAGAPAPAH